MRYKYFFAAVVTSVILCGTIAAQNVSLTRGDLKVLEGAEWTGTLTYRDYSTDKPTSIKSNILISPSKSNNFAWVFDMKYPLEPKANGTSDVVLSSDGRKLGEETVIERTKLPGGVLKVVTTKPGRDNGRDAVFRFTYLISPRAFSIRKEVRVNETDGYFERNIYKWTR